MTRTDIHKLLTPDPARPAWALGNPAGPGSTQVESLEEWLDLWLDTPEEEFASYDGEEVEASEADEELIEELGFTPAVAYRHN